METTDKKEKLQIKQMAIIAIMTAVTCVLAPLSLPIGPVPISLTMLAIFFSLYILGMKKGTLSYVIYLLLGLVGVPVFSGFTSGPAKLFGPTGGYLIGFIPMALVAGWFIDRYAGKWVQCLLGMVLGTLICYAFGTLWLAYEAGMDFYAALLAGVIPFIPGDLIKMVIAILVAPKIKGQLVKAGAL